MPALFCNDDLLADDLLKESIKQGDRLWRLPLWAPYRKMLDGAIADINNAPESSYAGAITAALFLESFVDADQSWGHIDVMAWNEREKPGRPQGGEAMGLRAVYAYIENKFNRNN